MKKFASGPPPLPARHTAAILCTYVIGITLWGRKLQTNLSTSSTFVEIAGGGGGGPESLSSVPFFIGINNPLGPAGGFNPVAMTLFSSWAAPGDDGEGRDAARASVARGERRPQSEPHTRTGCDAGGDQVFAAIHEWGVGADSGARVDQRRYFATTLRGGRLVRVQMFSERADALKAVGLEE